MFDVRGKHGGGSYLDRQSATISSSSLAPRRLDEGASSMFQDVWKHECRLIPLANKQIQSGRSMILHEGP